MTRRGDPEKIYQGQRAGVFMRLVREVRLDRYDAEQWVSRSERKAEELGRPRRSVGYWDEAWRWIEGERKARNQHRPGSGSSWRSPSPSVAVRR